LITLSSVSGDWDNIKRALPDIISEYEADIVDAESRLAIKGKTGSQALKDQCAWPIFYGVRKAEITKLAKYFSARVDAIRGELFKTYTEEYSRALPDRTKDKYIDNEDKYLRMYALFLEIDELREKFVAVCDAFDRRGFALRDWTLLKTSQSQDDII